MLKEFKAFAMRGNVVDLAVGVIIGGTFGKIVGSLIDDVITPLLLKPALDAANLSHLNDLTILGTVKYGVFLSAVINFIIVAFILFLIIKGMNAAQKKEEAKPAAPAPPPADIQLLTEIRNILKPGDQKSFKRVVLESDCAIFNDELLHRVCSTFALARDFEWSSRLFFIEMKDDDEEGVGTMLSIDHKSPAFVDEEVVFTATVETIIKNELICTIEAKVGGRFIATGKTGQKMLKR